MNTQTKKMGNEPQINPAYIVTCRHNNAWMWGVDPQRVKEANEHPESFACSCEDTSAYPCHRCGGMLTPKAVNTGNDLIDGEEGHNEDCPLLDDARDINAEVEDCVECGHSSNNHSDTCVSVE